MIIQDGIYTPGIRTYNIVAQSGNIRNLSINNCYLTSLYVNYIKVNGNVDINGNLNVTNNFNVNGNTTLGNAISDTTTVNGNLSVSNDFNVNGNTTLGNAISDTTTVNGNLVLNNSLTYSTENIDSSGNLSTDVIVSLIDCSGYSITVDLNDITTIGQIKVITLVTGDCILNVNLTDGNSTATFNAIGSSLNLLSVGANGWAVLSTYNTSIS